MFLLLAFLSCIGIPEPHCSRLDDCPAEIKIFRILFLIMMVFVGFVTPIWIYYNSNEKDSEHFTEKLDFDYGGGAEESVADIETVKSTSIKRFRFRMLYL